MLLLSTLFGVLTAMAYTTSRAWDRTLRSESEARPRALLLQGACALALVSASLRFARTSAGPFFGVAAGLVVGHLLSIVAVRRLR